MQNVSIESFTHYNRHLFENSTNWNKAYDIEVFNTDDGGYNLPEHNLVVRLETNEASETGAKIFARAAFHDVLVSKHFEKLQDLTVVINEMNVCSATCIITFCNNIL